MRLSEVTIGQIFYESNYGEHTKYLASEDAHQELFPNGELYWVARATNMATGIEIQFSAHHDHQHYLKLSAESDFWHPVHVGIGWDETNERGG